MTDISEKMLKVARATMHACYAEFRFQAFTPEELGMLFETCGLRVVRIIGKPILFQLIPRERRDEIIGRNFEKILKLELKFCDAPSLVGIVGHLEIVGVKQE